jgi:type VI secretion system protein ImpA
MNARSDHFDDVALAPLDGLLAPLAPDAPCGGALRHDAVFTEIRLLREEDDPSLPMGQWARPLKRADWPAIERLCIDLLAHRSKDLQIALWLAESWMRQHGLAGLAHGLALVDALLRRYWPQLHPAIEDDGDADARLASLEWLNEALSASLALHAVLFTVEGERPLPVTLADWGQMAARETASAAPAGTATQPTRAEVLAQAGQLGPALAYTGAASAACLDALASIGTLLRTQLGDAAPQLARLQGVLEAILRVLAQIRPTEAVAEPDIGERAPIADAVAEAAPVSATVDPARWRNRSEAYRTLEALADYLADVEPHSPTPFLLRRAANWGQMSLPEVIAEIIREEGDASRLFNILGVNTSR